MGPITTTSNTIPEPWKPWNLWRNRQHPRPNPTHQRNPHLRPNRHLTPVLNLQRASPSFSSLNKPSLPRLFTSSHHPSRHNVGWRYLPFLTIGGCNPLERLFGAGPPSPFQAGRSHRNWYRAPKNPSPKRRQYMEEIPGSLRF